MKRAYQGFLAIQKKLDQYVYLRNLQDSNETLFYGLLQQYLPEMMPVIYTPTVGVACQRFSHIYQKRRGLFISYPNRDRITGILQNLANRNIKIIVVTDGERILGLGDQGAGGMGIPIGKLSLYTACGGLNPAHGMPIMLDVGTNNQDLLNDPLYIGWRHPRISADEYYHFMENFVKAVQQVWPETLVHFEDFAQHSALQLLNIYQDRLLCFNGDIQGTAAVTLGYLISALHSLGSKISEQRIVFGGSGSAGCGIAQLIIEEMKQEGLSEEEAKKRIFMTGSKGLLTEQMFGLSQCKSQLAQKMANLNGWHAAGSNFSLLETVQQAKPTILIGVSGQPKMFSENIIRAMHSNCAKPIIMPLSNPSSHAEATPEEIMRWTNGAALVATGSPFEAVTMNGNCHHIPQCNNAYVYPGLGLGIMASRAKRVTQRMFIAASHALAREASKENGDTGCMLPELKRIPQVSRAIGFSVAKEAMNAGVAEMVDDEVLAKRIEDNYWQPNYRSYRYSSL